MNNSRGRRIVMQTCGEEPKSDIYRYFHNGITKSITTTSKYNNCALKQLV